MWKYIINDRLLEKTWVLADYSAMSWLLPLLVATLTLKRNDITLWRTVLFSTIVLLLEYISADSDWQALFPGQGNAAMYHLYSPIFVFLLFTVYQRVLFSGRWKKLYWLIVIGFALFAIINALWLDFYTNFPSKTAGMYSVFGMALPVAYFIKTLNEMKVEYLEREPMFWISTGMLIYFAGSFLFWTSLSFLTFERDFFDSVYAVVSWLTILLNIFLCVALLVNSADGNRKPYPSLTTVSS